MNYKIIVILITSLFIISPDVANAATTVGNVLCKAVEVIETDVAKGLATLAILIVGFGALLGRVQWGMAIVVAVGVGVIFGAGDIVNALGVNGQCGTSAGGGEGGGSIGGGDGSFQPGS